MGLKHDKKATWPRRPWRANEEKLKKCEIPTKSVESKSLNFQFKNALRLSQSLTVVVLRGARDDSSRGHRFSSFFLAIA